MVFHLERLERAHPLHRARMNEFLLQAGRAGFSLLIVRCYATPAEQLDKWRQGRIFNKASGYWEIMEMSQVVTRAKPGTSAHEIIGPDHVPAAMATDVIPVDGAGKPLWTTPDEVWKKLYKIAEHVGLDAAGDPFGRYLGWDKGHFEEPAYHVILDPLGLRMPDVSTLAVEV
jgi:hypothetical protein